MGNETFYWDGLMIMEVISPFSNELHFVRFHTNTGDPNISHLFPSLYLHTYLQSAGDCFCYSFL